MVTYFTILQLKNVYTQNLGKKVLKLEQHPLEENVAKNSTLLDRKQCSYNLESLEYKINV